MMKQANISDSSATAMFSARLRSHRPSAAESSSVMFCPARATRCAPPDRPLLANGGQSGSSFDRARSLDRVDLFHCAFRPVGAVFVGIFLLGERPEGVEVRRVDLLAFLLEVFERLGFLGIEALDV